jgi:hypothetical protein
VRTRTFSFRGAVLGAVALGLLLTGARSAEATGIPPAQEFTLVEVTSADVLSILCPMVLPPAESGNLFNQTFYRFPITGFTGPASTPLTIQHAGGVKLQGNGNQVAFTNFLIDLTVGKLFAEVNGSGVSNFPLFDLVPCAAIGDCPVGGASSILTGIGLNFTDEARAAVADLFMVNIPAGFQFGIAKQITLIPEPGTALLALTGLAGLAFASRSRTPR